MGCNFFYQSTTNELENLIDNEYPKSRFVLNDC